MHFKWVQNSFECTCTCTWPWAYTKKGIADALAIFFWCPYNLGYPIDGKRWSESQSINQFQSIKVVNWYWSVNRWSINDHTKIVHRLASTGTGPRNRRHACYLSNQPPFLGSSGDEIGKTILIQSSQCKEYTPLHMHSHYPLSRHCLSVL